MNFIESLSIKVHCTKLREAQILPPKSFSGLNKLREELPQFSSIEDVNSFSDFCKCTGTRVSKKSFKAYKLNPSQSHVDSDKIISIVQDYTQSSPPVIDPIVIDRDGYIIDGHHRWAALMYVNPNMEIPCYQFNVKIKHLLGNKVPRWQDTIGDNITVESVNKGTQIYSIEIDSDRALERKFNVFMKSIGIKYGIQKGSLGNNTYAPAYSGYFIGDEDQVAKIEKFGKTLLGHDETLRIYVTKDSISGLKESISGESSLDDDITEPDEMFDAMTKNVIINYAKLVKLFVKRTGKLVSVVDRQGIRFIYLREVKKGVSLEVWFPGNSTPEVKVFNHWAPEYAWKIIKILNELKIELMDYWISPLSDEDIKNINALRVLYRQKMSIF